MKLKNIQLITFLITTVVYGATKTSDTNSFLESRCQTDLDSELEVAVRFPYDLKNLFGRAKHAEVTFSQDGFDKALDRAVGVKNACSFQTLCTEAKHTQISFSQDAWDAALHTASICNNRVLKDVLVEAKKNGVSFAQNAWDKVLAGAYTAQQLRHIFTEAENAKVTFSQEAWDAVLICSVAMHGLICIPLETLETLFPQAKKTGIQFSPQAWDTASKYAAGPVYNRLHSERNHYAEQSSIQLLTTSIQSLDLLDFEY